MKTGADLLSCAGDLVRRGWTQHADARSAEGDAVEPWDDAAAAWSLLGALVAALEEQGESGRELPLVQLASALDELAGLIDDDSLSRWNDDPSRRQEEVVAVLDAAAVAAGRLRS